LTNETLTVIDQSHCSFTITGDEEFYGGGEVFSDLNHRGKELDEWVTQAAGSASSDQYKASPVFVSSRGYSVIVDTHSRVGFDFGVESSTSGEISVDSTSLSFVVSFDESVKESVQSVSNHIERPSNPPLWTYGFWISRNSYRTWDEVEDIAGEFRSRSIPCDVIHIDPGWMGQGFDFDLEWGETTFENPVDHLEDLDDQGFSTSIWEYPYIQADSDLFEKAKDNDYLVKDGEGNVLLFYSLGNLGAVDFTNPEAFEWWTDINSKRISEGVDVIKADFGEYLPERSVLSNGKTGTHMRNYYSTLFQQSCRRAFEKSDKDPVLWSRSGWAKQSEGSIHWGGDPRSSWGGFERSIKSGLNLLLSGYLYWSCDCGGYKQKPSDKLYGEWMKWGALGMSHMRSHGKTPREPWEYDSVCEEVVDVLQERYDLMPYLYTYGEYATESGTPLIRPMEMEHNVSELPRGVSVQHYTGPNFIVAPFITPDRSRSMFIPDGEWVSYWTGEKVEGSQVIDVEYSEEEPIPFYVKAGSVLPKQEEVDHLKDGYRNPHLYVTSVPSEDVERDIKYYDPESERMIDISVEWEDDTVKIDADTSEFTSVKLADSVEFIDEIIFNGETVEICS
jgi:alpha-D-xyloside xylohydrolase